MEPIKFWQHDIQYSKVNNRTAYDVIVGCIDIATIWAPDKRAAREKYKVRLNFKQERGKVDYTKDRHFDTLELAKSYIHREFKKAIKTLAIYYGIIA